MCGNFCHMPIHSRITPRRKSTAGPRSPSSMPSVVVRHRPPALPPATLPAWRRSCVISCLDMPNVC
eukprot:4125392-Pyramimonas_sp.AAC.1